jgi:hypothetical protein
MWIDKYILTSMATFQEVFDAMLKKVEDLNEKDKRSMETIEYLEEQIRNLEYENKILKKSQSSKNSK